MPRTGRILLPYHPHHIVQRGHNKQVVFAAENDFIRYLADLKELKEKFEVQVFAFCLMTNHVHLLLAPGNSTANLSKLMKTLAARATRYRNKLEGRTGTLWESRYKSSPIQTDQYLLACCRYIELNPVRAHMVEKPENYQWSSFRQRLGFNQQDNWIDLDPSYLNLAVAEETRRERYRQFVKDAIPTEELQFIRDALQRGQLTGNNKFIDEVENILGKRIEFRAQGRPGK